MILFDILHRTILDNNETNDSVIIGKINFFIDMPIELFVVDTLWSCFVASAHCSKKSLKYCNGNVIHEDLLSLDRRKNLKGRIHFKSLPFYKKYYEQYVSWKNDAIEHIETRYNRKKNSALLALDFSNFFYSVSLDFDKLKKELIEDDQDYINYLYLHIIAKRIYERYTQVLKPYFSAIHEKQIIIPIGLVSSGLLANMYFEKYDNQLKELDCVVYYKRYVDDMLFVLDIDKLPIEYSQDSPPNKMLIKTILTKYLNIFDIEADNLFRVKGEKYLSIKNDKVKFIYVGKEGTTAIIEKLKEENFRASEHNLFPTIISDLNKFSASMYKDSESLKLRDANEVVVDVKKMTSLIQSVLFSLMGGLSNDVILSKEQLEKFKKQIKTIFPNDIIISLKNRWDKLLFFFDVLFNGSDFFEKKIRNSIKSLKKPHGKKTSWFASGYKDEKYLLNNMKDALNETLDIALSSNRALVGKTSGNKLAMQIRHSNMFDYTCISMPLLNYYDFKEEINLFATNQEKLFNVSSRGCSLNNFKIQYSPVFIHFSQFEYIQLLINCSQINNVSFLFNLLNRYKKEVFPLFSSSTFDCVKIKDITPKNTKNYKLVEIEMPQIYKNMPTVDSYIGLANINMKNHKLTNDVEIDGETKTIMDFSQYGCLDFKKDLIYLLTHNRNLNKSSRKDDETESDQKVRPAKYLVFPETFLEIEWLPLLEKYARRTMTTVVTGIKYFKQKKRVFNLQATIIPFVKDDFYRNSIVVLREKNDYAPYEKTIIDNSGYNSSNAKKPIYYRFISQDASYFTSFVCYELTDIFARALLRDRVDFVVASEFNYDINYFSNIIESTSRELFSYVAQVNSSDAGDTRLIAPYHNYYKTIASISGGERSFVHVGKINISNLRNYLLQYKSLDVSPFDYSSLNKDEKTKMFKKPSARSKLTKH